MTRLGFRNGRHFKLGGKIRFLSDPNSLGEKSSCSVIDQGIFERRYTESESSGVYGFIT